jgi:hypothetical protein
MPLRSDIDYISVRSAAGVFLSVGAAAQARQQTIHGLHVPIGEHQANPSSAHTGDNGLHAMHTVDLSLAPHGNQLYLGIDRNIAAEGTNEHAAATDVTTVSENGPAFRPVDANTPFDRFAHAESVLNHRLPPERFATQGLDLEP